MFLSMIKKEMIQFFRSKSNLIMMFLFPIILIATLGSGLESMMTNSKEIFGEDGKKDIVYYSVNGEANIYEEGFLAFKEGVESEVDVEFKESSDLETIIEKVDENDALFHINILEKGFEIYTPKNGTKFKGEIMKSIFESVLNEYAIHGTIAKFNIEALNSMIEDNTESYVEYKNSQVKREVTSKEYYTFAELALIILYIATCVGESVYKENQLTTINRIRLSKVSESLLILSKVIVGVMIGLAQTLIVYVFSELVMDVNWGENTIKFILLFAVFSLFTSMLGAIIGILCKKETALNGIISAIIFIVCALGGSYTPLAMLVGIPGINKLIYLSPIYWINTATSSMITGYNSDAYIFALGIPIILSTIILIAYLIFAKKKGGLQNA